MLRKNKEPQRKWRSIEAHTSMQFWPRQKHCLGACVRHREKWRTQSSLQARNEHAVQGEVEKDVQDGTAPYSEVFCKLTTAQQFKSANRAISVQTGRPWSHLIFNLARSLRTATNPRSCTRGKQTWHMATYGNKERYSLCLLLLWLPPEVEYRELACEANAINTYGKFLHPFQTSHN